MLELTMVRTYVGIYKVAQTLGHYIFKALEIKLHDFS